jgi:hypothetical protein
MRPMISNKDLAKGLNVAEGTPPKWRLAGTGPRYLRIGRRIVYDPVDVEEWLDARRVTSTSEVL